MSIKTNKWKSLWHDQRAQSTVEAGLVLVIYVLIILGLITLADFGLLSKRNMEAARYIAWNNICNHQDGPAILEDVYFRYHQGAINEVSLTRLGFPLPGDNPIAEAVLANTMRTVSSNVVFDYEPDYPVALPDDTDNLTIANQHTVDTRGNLMMIPPMVVIHTTPGGSGNEGGNDNDEPPPPPPPPEYF